MSTAPDPVLVALAAKHPELDAIRWRVRLPNDAHVNIAGEKVDTDDSRRLVFVLDDGTERTFESGEWSSAIATPGMVEPNLDQIIRRLHLFGLADLHDIVHQGSWYQAQPEWIEHERERLADEPDRLSDMEYIHYQRSRGH